MSRFYKIRKMRTAYYKFCSKGSGYMIDKQLLRMRFSKQAKTYDEYANVQKKDGKEII